MAVFASRYERKLPIDDTQALSCEITAVQEVAGHTVARSRGGRAADPSEKSIIVDDFMQAANVTVCVSACRSTCCACGGAPATRTTGPFCAAIMTSTDWTSLSASPASSCRCLANASLVTCARSS